MGRRSQALVGVGLLVAGVLCAVAGSLGSHYGVDWLADGAAFPAGLLFALAVVFLLRAALTGPARSWAYFASGPPAQDQPPPPPRQPQRRRDGVSRAEQTLEIVGDDDDPQRRR